MGGKVTKSKNKNVSSSKHQTLSSTRKGRGCPSKVAQDEPVHFSSDTTTRDHVFVGEQLVTEPEGKDVTLEKETSSSRKIDQVLPPETQEEDATTEPQLDIKEEFVFEFNSGNTTEHDSVSDGGESVEDSEECVQLSNSIWSFPSKRISKHGQIFEGELRSGAFGVRPIVLKFGPNDKHTINEAQIMNKLNQHTHIVSLIHSDLYSDGLFDQIYIAMDKCHSENLREFVVNRKNQGDPFNFGRALEILGQIIEGMKHIHEKKIIHRDIKPDNIFFSLNQKLIKIADFGLSIEIDSDSVFEKGQFGTDGYRPPESFGKAVISLKSDVFSLGVTFYYVLSDGEHPFGEDSDSWNYNMQHLIIDLSRLLVPNVKTVQHLIHCMIEQKHNNRPTICQVSEHPCWTGREVECNFDYHCPESSVSCVPPNETEPVLKLNAAYVQKFTEFLRAKYPYDDASQATNSRGVQESLLQQPKASSEQVSFEQTETAPTLESPSATFLQIGLDAAERSPAFANYLDSDDWRRDFGDFSEMMAMIQNLRHLTNTLDAGSTISARDNKNITRQRGATRKSGLTLLPQILLPSDGVNGSSVRGGAQRRITKECQDLLKDSKFEVIDDGYDDIYYWKAVIHGPPGTPYEGGKFRVYIALPNDYPFKPPQIRSNVKIFHPNMQAHDNHAVMLCCINRWWSPAYLISEAILIIFRLLYSPISEHIVNHKVARLYWGDRQKFNEIAREWTMLYAL